MATMLPDDLKESVGVMNAQGQQVMREDKNWLYLVGGYGWNNASGKNITYSKVRIVQWSDVTQFLRAHIICPSLIKYMLAIIIRDSFRLIASYSAFEFLL